MYNTVLYVTIHWPTLVMATKLSAIAEQIKDCIQRLCICSGFSRNGSLISAGNGQERPSSLASNLKVANDC